MRFEIFREAGVSTTDTRVRLFLLRAARDEENDFRLPLAAALEQHGVETYYIWLRKRPMIMCPGAKQPLLTVSFMQCVLFLMSFRTADALNVYFNSTNARFPVTSVFLRLLCAPGIWCLDAHDDLLYGGRGWRWVKDALALKLLVLCSDVILCAAENLKELFPRAKHLGNASHINSLVRGTRDFQKILIIASIDARFDFALMAKTAARCRDVEFHVYGAVDRNAKDTKAQLEKLCVSRPNIYYHGPYAMKDLTKILAQYSVSFAPYRSNVRSTRYIDPLRYYHCLNSGMELITTKIPQAMRLNKAVHIVDSAEEFARILGRLKNDPSSLKNVASHYSRQTWEMRVARLLDIVFELPRARRIAKRFPIRT